MIPSTDTVWPLQVEGAFIQGLGLLTSEEVIHDENTGRLITDGTWEYKIPAATCIPRQFNATFLKVVSLHCWQESPGSAASGRASCSRLIYAWSSHAASPEEKAFSIVGAVLPVYGAGEGCLAC